MIFCYLKIHVGIQLFGYFLMWISTGFVTTLYEGFDHTSQHCLMIAEELSHNSSIFDNQWTQDSFNEWLDKCTTENRSLTHSALGITSFIFHNIVMLMSFPRSRRDSIRNFQVIIHSHLGYFVAILSGKQYFSTFGPFF